MLRFTRTRMTKRTIPGAYVLTRKRSFTKSTLPSVTLFQEASSVVNDTYEPTRKVCLLANTYTKMILPVDDKTVNFSPMLETLKMSPFDFFCLIYIYLENERRLNKHQLLEYTPRQFNNQFDTTRFHEMVRNTNGNIDIVDGLNIGLLVTHSDAILIDAEKFKKANGESTIYRIVLPHIYKRMREEFFGHYSICNHTTRKCINYALDQLLFSNRSIALKNGIVNDETLNYILKKEMFHYITEDFITNSKFYNNDTEVDIGKLMDKYAISSSDLFHAMYHVVDPITENAPYQYGNRYIVTCDHRYIFTREKAAQVLALTEKSADKYYIKYHNCRPIKQRFRSNYGEPQPINIKEYENRSYKGAFYTAIFSCMFNALKN